MGNLHRNLDASSFWRFREFFRSITFRSLDGIPYPGASGASSAIFPTLDTLFWVKQSTPLSPLSDAIKPRIRDSDYTTVYDMAEATRLALLHGALPERFQAHSEILKHINILIDALARFRNNHRGQVRKFIPETMAWRDPGTGWVADVATYLGEKIDNTKKAKR